MSTPPPDLKLAIKRLVIERLFIEGMEPEDLTDEMSLKEELGLDSVDALELAVCLEQEFGIKIVGAGMDHSTFESVQSLADFVHERQAAQAS